MKLAATRKMVSAALFCFIVAIECLAIEPQPATPRLCGTSSAQARQEAAAAIPYRFLRPSDARRIRQIVNKPTIFRRLPIKTIDCNHEMFTFLIRNPEVVVGIWQNMGVTKLSMTRLGGHTYEASDGQGTVSQFELLYGAPRVHVYYGTGYYEGSLFKRKLRGQCVLIVRSSYRRTPQGRIAITNVLDVFVDIENAALDLAVKTLCPLFIRTADENLIATANFLSQLSYTAELNPDRVIRLAGELRQINPEVRQEFAKVVQSAGEQTVTQHRAARALAQVRYQAPPRADPPSRGDVIISRFPPDFPRYR